MGFHEIDLIRTNIVVGSAVLVQVSSFEYLIYIVTHTTNNYVLKKLHKFNYICGDHQEKCKVNEERNTPEVLQGLSLIHI